MSRLSRLALLALAAGVAGSPLRAQSTADSFVWLEDLHGEKSMAWVAEHNRATLAELQAFPAYDSIYTRTLGILNSKERIAYPRLRGGRIYNFWTDAKHPRGLWRRSPVAAYLAGHPEWETVLDIDSLSAAEKTTWAFAGADCLEQLDRYCLISLSRGGGDAVEMREFNAVTKEFVKPGFFLPEAKGGATWEDSNTVLVSTDFGPNSMTTSGYPRIAKRWRRGTPLAQARVLFEGKPTDVSVSVGTTRVLGRRVPVIGDGVTFFQGVNFVLEGDSLRRLDIPLDADWYTLGDRLAVYLRTEWKVGGHTWPQGALIGIGYRPFMAGSRAFQSIVAAGGRTTIESVASTKTELLVKLLNNVQSELHRYRYASGRWIDSRVPAPVLGNVSVASTSDFSDQFFFVYESFVQPTTLYQVTAAGTVRPVARLPGMFDATGLEVRQLGATSRDGTHVPYFIVNRKGLKQDGDNPTLLTAYGGFQISSLPRYDPVTGAAWLERGGVLVLANIRGGGEFGPAWHRAAQKENKQRSYDDFIAVAQDLIARKITAPARLGIVGGSNGGLLMGVMFTQRPDLFGAVVAEVPLLDMLRYTQMSAGASWVDEYGDPADSVARGYISKYSPYQNVFPDRTYPRVLFTTTTSDDRVGPAHARKMVAKLESMGYPVYFFENTEGGHGAGDTPEQRARMFAVTNAYLLKQLQVGRSGPAVP